MRVRVLVRKEKKQSSDSTRRSPIDVLMAPPQAGLFLLSFALFLCLEPLLVHGEQQRGWIHVFEHSFPAFGASLQRFYARVFHHSTFRRQRCALSLSLSHHHHLPRKNSLSKKQQTLLLLPSAPAAARAKEPEAGRPRLLAPPASTMTFR